MENLNETKKGKIVEFHTGRGGRFNNQGHIRFCGVGNSAKHEVENQNFLAFENESKIIESIEDEDEQEALINRLTDNNNEIDSEEYNAICKKYGDLGKVVLNDCDGNYIGDYVADGEEYCYDEDGDYDTTSGTLVTEWDDLSDNQKDAILESNQGYLFEHSFDIDLDQYRDNQEEE
jgi:hypothetical protein